MTETIEVHPIVFPPEVLARISPELSLQRHLSLNTRPCSRGFEEFREVIVNDGNISRYSEKCQNKTTNNVIGSNVLRSGKTFVITSIIGGIIEETLPAQNIDVGEEELIEMTTEKSRLDDSATVYPVVEIQRGRVGAPTDEEMITSERLHNTLLHSGILSKKELNVACGVRTTNADGKISITYPDEASGETNTPFNSKRKWSYVLYAKIQVFSRNGPIFDLCWNSLLYALQTVRLPRAFLDERATDLKIPVKTRGRSMAIRETYDIICDSTAFIPLKVNKDKLYYASNFGIIDLDPLAQFPTEDGEMEIEKPDSVLLADIETEAEESSIQSTLSFINDKDGNFTCVRMVGGGSKITLDYIKKCIFLSKNRSEDLASKI